MSTEPEPPKRVGRAPKKRELPKGYGRYFLTLESKLWRKVKMRGIEEERSASEVIDQAIRMYLESTVVDRED